MADTFVLYNGHLISKRDLYHRFHGDWPRHAPGFFDSLRVFHFNISNWDLHFARMKRAAAWWQMELPDETTLFTQLVDFIHQTKGNGKLRIQWTPDGKTWHYMAIFEPRNTQFQWPEKGLSVGVFTEAYKWVTDTANLKLNERNVYLRARDWAQDHSLDDAILTNPDGKIADSTSCNVFWIDKGILYTPSLSSGCVQGVMREIILKHSSDIGWEVQELDTDALGLLEMEEVFLTNALRGVIPVQKIGGRGKPILQTRTVYDAVKALHEPIDPSAVLNI